MYSIFYYKQKILDKFSDEDSHTTSSLMKFYVGCEPFNLELSQSLLWSSIWRKKLFGVFWRVFSFRVLSHLFYQRADLSVLCSISNL